jgi:hypothetical protein
MSGTLDSLSEPSQPKDPNSPMNQRQKTLIILRALISTEAETNPKLPNWFRKIVATQNSTDAEREEPLISAEPRIRSAPSRREKGESSVQRETEEERELRSVFISNVSLFSV